MFVLLYVPRRFSFTDKRVMAVHILLVCRLTMNCFCDEVCMFYPGATNLVYQIVCSTLKFGDLNIKLVCCTYCRCVLFYCLVSDQCGLCTFIY